MHSSVWNKVNNNKTKCVCVLSNSLRPQLKVVNNGARDFLRPNFDANPMQIANQMLHPSTIKNLILLFQSFTINYSHSIFYKCSASRCTCSLHYKSEMWVSLLYYSSRLLVVILYWIMCESGPFLSYH